MRLQTAGNEITLAAASLGATATDPDLVALADGRLLVVWGETLGTPTDAFDDVDGAVFGQILSGAGIAQGEIFQINDWTPFPQGGPEAVAMRGGSFAVAWTSTATYGDRPQDADIFLRHFDAQGLPSPLPTQDLFLDTPDREGGPHQILHEIAPLSFGRYAVIAQDLFPDGSAAIVFDANGTVAARLGWDIDDLAQTVDGNIVTATAAGTDIHLTLTNANFSGPEGIVGVYAPLRFAVEGSGGSKLADSLQLAALSGGGAALVYAEQSGENQALRFAILSEEARLEAEGEIAVLPEALAAAGGFDIIGLSGGGFALAVTVPGSGESARIDVFLYDEDGRLLTRLAAGEVDADGQSQPSLAELPDGRIALAFVDGTDTGPAAGADPLRLTFFDVEGPKGRFLGTEGDDMLGGLGGHDRIAGLGGADELLGRGGDDRLLGGDGNDSLSGGAGQDALRGGEDNDRLLGNGGDDGLGGGGGADVLKGGGGRDVLGGGAGDDRLFGNAGRDVLKGGLGHDVLSGGGGPDTFVFVRGRSGNDRITDFDAAQDVLRIDLRGADASSIEVTVAGGSTEIGFGDDTVLLEGVELGRSDILFDLI